MAKAYVKIWAKGGRERDVRESLIGLDEVMTADITAGDQDLMCLVEAPSYDALLKLVMENIRKIPGIDRTTTNFIVE